ncbi:PucR family transcriptional regulator [Phascolarctobacterium sp.]
MSVTCQDLLPLKYFERIKLVAGQNGLDRTVTWPYVGQTSSVSQWVHGGELLFITGIAHSADKLKDLILECIQKKLAGLVILVGNEYINAIPEELLSQADAADFPLFEMPWDVKLIDVTREITDLIMRDKFEIKKSKNFLGRLLFASDVDYRQMLDTAVINDIKLLEYKFIAVFNVSYPAGEVLTDAGHDSIEDKLQHSVGSLCKEKQLPVTTLVYGNNVICLASASTAEKAAEAAAYLETVYGLLKQIYSGSDLYLSFGRPYTAIEQIKASYQEAQKALLLWKKMERREHIVYYSKLGLYRLLFKIDDKEEIREYYRYNLGALLQHDSKNNSELLETLRQYLYCNGSLVKTSQSLFIHRNTLLYRLNQIRDLLGRDIDDALVRLDLLNSIVAKDYLDE